MKWCASDGGALAGTLSNECDQSGGRVDQSSTQAVETCPQLPVSFVISRNTRFHVVSDLSPLHNHYTFSCRLSS
jgi:hypothetical protein